MMLAREEQQSFYWMDNNSLASESSSVSEERQRFEVDEVVWAKIQGYPWWPAYIGDVDAATPSALYKVYFFGDNSHSRLNPNKIRKFEEFFHNFAPLAKKNLKLRTALTIAQAQLTENHEDVSYFELQSAERKTMTPVEKKPAKNGAVSGEEVRARDAESQPVKRKPGRPRKILIVEAVSEQKIQTKNKIELTEPNVLKTEKTSDKPIAAEKQVIIEIPKQPEEKQISNYCELAADNHVEQKQVQQQQEQQEEQVLNNSEQSTNKRVVCKQIRRAKRLIGRSLFRQAFKELCDFKVDRQNILDILDLQILPALEEKLGTRSLLRFKERVKKALIERYFSFSHHHENALHHRSRHSLRGKTVRRLFGLLKVRNPRFSKQMVLTLEDSIQRRSQEKQQYMRAIVQLLSSGHLSPAKMEGLLEEEQSA